MEAPIESLLVGVGGVGEANRSDREDSRGSRNWSSPTTTLDRVKEVHKKVGSPAEMPTGSSMRRPEHDRAPLRNCIQVDLIMNAVDPGL